MIAAGSVLVVEDDPDVRELLELVLTADGHRVVVCATPEQVLERAYGMPGALAVVDFWGRSHQSLAADERDELARLARAVPTILVTGRVWADRETGEELGLVGLVKKPFDVFDLAARVSRVAERANARSARAGRTAAGR